MTNVVFSSSEFIQKQNIAEMDRNAMAQTLLNWDREIEVSKTHESYYSEQLLKTKKQNENVKSEIDKVERQLSSTEGVIKKVWKTKCDWTNRLTEYIEEEQENRELIEASIELTEANIELMKVECFEIKEMIKKFEKIALNLQHEIEILEKNDGEERKRTNEHEI